MSLALTRSGPGITVDGDEYLHVATSFSAHGALSMPYQSYDEPYQTPVQLRPAIPLSQFPPAWPIVLGSAAAITGADPLTVARALNAAFLAAFALMIGVIVLRRSSSRVAAVTSMLLLAVPDLLVAHAQVWAEPLLLLGMAVTLLALDNRLRGDTRVRWIVVAMVGIALSVASRYAGLGIAIGAVFAVLVPRAPALRDRLRAAALLIAAAAAPVVAWTARNLTAIGRPSERAVGWHPPGWRVASHSLDPVATWLIGRNVGRGVVVVTLLAALAAGAVGAWRAPRLREPSVGLLAGSIGVGYLLVVFAARTVLDANVPFDGRVLLPLLPVMVIGVAGSLPTRPAARWALLGLAVAVLAGFVARAATLISQFPRGEIAGYRSARWVTSPTLEYLRALPESTVIITNAPDVVHLYLDPRVTVFVPLRSNLYAGGRNRSYARQVASVASAVRGHRAVLAFFDRPTRGTTRGVAPGLADSLGMRDPRRFEDGIVFTRL
ncbi:MAG: hypothetical protein QOI47_2196 [Actinomycetota bacterium]|nr:hypothetical protein [Actinomycetota bacterium]